MPSLPLLGTLLDAAVGSARGTSPAPATNGPDTPTSAAPFAQTLRQSVQSQRQANGAQPGGQSGAATPSNGNANAADPSAPTTSAGTPTNGAKPSSGKDDDNTGDSATQAAQTTPDPAQAAALAAAAVQAQLQARPDAASQPVDEAADAAASIADAANTLAAKLDAQASGAKTDTADAAGSAPTTIRDALQAALDKLTNGGQGAAAPTVTPGTGGGSRAGADSAPLRAPLAAKGLLADKALAAPSATAAAATDAAAAADSTGDAKPAAGALTTSQPAVESGQASLAAASAALQQSVPTTQQAGAAVAGATHALAPQVGGPDWADALGQKVVFLSNAHQQSAELTLNPPDLGPLQVVLRVADNHAHALFVSQHAQVREAVEAALPKLREAMESGGLGLGSASVSDGSFGAAQQQNPQQQSARGQGAQRGFGASTADDALGDADAALAGTATRRVVGMVDTFA